MKCAAVILHEKQLDMAKRAIASPRRLPFCP
ncbi:hypothetical protein BN435_1494 [Erwinia amylovora 01SFR-BO]|uniref:Uncharacterized protein n=1 Tax=Erwinia amylovora ATCC BAA-2158 TaxID=889211 RepID=E5B4A3_ERWAM|nr:hypothetical protein predicted by Glimmer/Critica [Erwinia amylovora ATCC BAA-2158]CCO82089.1 hypothetical protein BN433_1511 [Erwinia amylovora Ea266]CCO89672.1 hypothetical protein BN435_1494 [Erwinia amylovora 01SFR-BO]CCO98781.1 hypothetical protein BN438_1493 [Erwinia amylovora UPN527]